MMFSADILRQLTQCVTNICPSVDMIKYKHCDFTLCPSSTAASISKPRQFCIDLTNVLWSLKKSMTNFGNITCAFQTAGYVEFLKPYPVAGCVDTAY